MAADEASGGGAEHTMMSRVMAGDAADHGALQAALGVGRMSRERKRGRSEQSDNYFHDEHPRVAIRTDNRGTHDPVPRPAGSDAKGHSGMVRKHQTRNLEIPGSLVSLAPRNDARALGIDAFVQCRIADCIPPGFRYLKLQLMSAATAPGAANDGAPQNGRLLFCNPALGKNQ
jgi:hypothetical protein